MGKRDKVSTEVGVAVLGSGEDIFKESFQTGH